MIEIGSGNLLEANADALVNTVNCDGFMGKGIALQFKQAFPRNFKAYEQAAKRVKSCRGRCWCSTMADFYVQGSSLISRQSATGGTSRGSRTLMPA